jgi:hypothetical protein
MRSHDARNDMTVSADIPTLDTISQLKSRLVSLLLGDSALDLLLLDTRLQVGA